MFGWYKFITLNKKVIKCSPQASLAEHYLKSPKNEQHYVQKQDKLGTIVTRKPFQIALKLHTFVNH